MSNSLALITDATHLASDLTGFLVSLAAIWMATKPPTAKMSFGYYRAGNVLCLLSGVSCLSFIDLKKQAKHKGHSHSPL